MVDEHGNMLKKPQVSDVSLYYFSLSFCTQECTRFVCICMHC